MTGETTVDEASLLLRRSEGVFALDRGKAILAGEMARLFSTLEGTRGDGGVSGLFSAAMTAFEGMLKDGG